MQKPKPDRGGFELEITKGNESLAWSTVKVNQLMAAIEDGYKVKSTPFYDGNPNLRKGNIVFEYTNKELQEIQKCARDIVYFANNYCTVMTDNGLQTIKLRPYQERMLRQFQKERFNVCLASRQVGKCSVFSTEIFILRDGKGIKTTIGKLYYQMLKIQRKLTFLERTKYTLWKFYSWLDSFDKKQVEF